MDPIVLLEYFKNAIVCYVGLKLLFFQFIVKSHDYVRHSMYVKTWENHVSNIHVLHALVCVCVCVCLSICVHLYVCVFSQIISCIMPIFLNQILDLDRQID